MLILGPAKTVFALLKVTAPTTCILHEVFCIAAETLFEGLIISGAANYSNVFWILRILLKKIALAMKPAVAEPAFQNRFAETMPLNWEKIAPPVPLTFSALQDSSVLMEFAVAIQIQIAWSHFLSLCLVRKILFIQLAKFQIVLMVLAIVKQLKSG